MPKVEIAHGFTTDMVYAIAGTFTPRNLLDLIEYKNKNHLKKKEKSLK